MLVEQLIRNIEQASLGAKNKQPLLATLKAALASLNRGDTTSALNQLFAFQNKVLAQIASSNSALAAQLTAASQEIVDAISKR